MKDTHSAEELCEGQQSVRQVVHCNDRERVSVLGPQGYTAGVHWRDLAAARRSEADGRELTLCRVHGLDLSGVQEPTERAAIVEKCVQDFWVLSFEGCVQSSRPGRDGRDKSEKGDRGQLGLPSPSSELAPSCPSSCGSDRARRKEIKLYSHDVDVGERVSCRVEDGEEGVDGGVAEVVHQEAAEEDVAHVLSCDVVEQSLEGCELV